ncbi:MAG: tetratricopeptide repeat protein [candidate division Zixibacteria bacterium]|nr:tetratricopeptide repeat protein [candidate division Zixibacteria bacterium]
MKNPSVPAASIDGRISKKWFLTLFFFALSLRLIYLAEIHDYPTFKYPTVDARYHDEWAQAVAHGKLTQPQAFFRAPLYPYLLGLVYYIFGHNYYAPRIVQHLIGSIGIVLLALLTTRLFGKKTGVVTGFVFAAYASAIYFEGELLLDFLLIPLDVLIFIFLYKAKENPNPVNWLLAGLWLGLSAITRPNILIFIPAVLFWTWFSFRQRERFKGQLKFAALFLLGTALPILPAALHNHRAEKPLVLIASQGGINFYIGNNPEANGFTSMMPGRPATNWELADIRSLAKEETGRELSSAELSDFWYKKGLEFWKSRPADAFKLLARKTYLFFTRFEIANNPGTIPEMGYAPLLRFLPVGFWFIGPLGLLGAVFSFVNRKARLLSVFVLIYSASVIPFFVNARFRLPVLPFLTLFSVYAVFELWKHFREKKNPLPYVAVLAIFSFLVNSNLSGFAKTPNPAGFFQLGNVFLEQGNYAEARQLFHQTLQADPRFKFAHLNLGVAALKMGDLKTAEEEFKKELEADPQSEKAPANLSLIQRLRGFPRLAVYWAEKSVRAKPYFQDAYLNWALAYRALGQPESAMAVLEKGEKNSPRFLLGLFLKASFLVEAKRFPQAEPILLGLLDSLEDYQPSYDPQPFFVASREFGENTAELKSRIFYLLGRSRGEQGNFRPAMEYFQQALAENRANADAAADLGTALLYLGRPGEALPYFERALPHKSENFALHFNYGLTLMELNRLPEARAAFKKSLELNPNFSPARERLSILENLLKSGQ